MESTVCFRDFEERDIDFVYQCKNNEKLWKYTIGDFHKFSYEEAVGWVHGCMCYDQTYKFWAICKNDKKRDIVGWCGVAFIDYMNKTAEAYSIVIGDSDYSDGITWIEAIMYTFNYVFETLQFITVTISWYEDHPVSKYLQGLAKFDYFKPNTVFMCGIPHNVISASLSKESYFSDKIAGRFEMRSIIKRISQYSKLIHQ